MATKYNLTVTNPDLPVAETLDAQILAASSFVAWYQMDTRYATLAAGKVASIASRGGDLDPLAQASGSLQASLVTNGIAQFPALQFDGAEYMTVADTPDPEVAHTWAIIFRAGIAADEAIFGSRTDASNLTNFRIRGSDGVAIYTHGNATPSRAPLAGAWNLAVMGHDTVAASLEVNGGAPLSIATNNQGGPTTLVLGAQNGALAQPFTGRVADIIMLSGSPASNAGTIALIETFAAQVYGIPIS